MTERDKIEQLKRDLRSLPFYEKKQKEVNDELIRLARIMHEPKSIRYGEKLGGQIMNYLDLMEQEENLKIELNSYHFLISSTKDKLKILSDVERTLLERLYIKRQGFAYLASKMFVSERKLKYDVDEIIRKIVNNKA